MKKILYIIALSFVASLALIGSARATTPLAIQDLTCSVGGELGSVWLAWTVPANTIGYEARYNQGNTLNYNSAITHLQSWIAGASGERRQELIRGLNPGTEFTFGMKAIGAGSFLSPVSNPATCRAAAMPIASVDSLPPSTQITFPAANSTIQAGTSFIIKGVSRDKGLSSVQKVEISVDGGQNWSEARGVSNIDGNLSWEFNWTNPQATTVKIMARSYDWLNNREPSVELPIVVSSTIIKPIIPPLAVASPVVPITGEQAATAQLETRLQSLRVQLLNLLTQLLTQLQAQLTKTR